MSAVSPGSGIPSDSSMITMKSSQSPWVVMKWVTSAHLARRGSPRYRPKRSAAVIPSGEAAGNDADGVFQGGGVKGIALVGALIEFASRGWTNWVNVAGTSAGSIIAAYIACGHDAEDLEKLLRETPYPQFEDFGPGGKIIGGGLNLIRHHGLAH